MALKGGFFFNYGNKKLPIGKGSRKDIKKALLSPAAADIREELSKNKNYSHSKQILVLESKNYRQPKPPKSQKVVTKRKLDYFDEIARKTKYFLVSLVFFRLIARTPVDEDYWYYEKDKSKKSWGLEDIYYYATDPKTGKRVLRKRSESKQFEHENAVRRKFHEADNRKIRDEWYLKLGSIGVVFSSTDFNVDYDTAFKEGVTNTPTSEITKIMKEIGSLDDYPDFEDYEIWNTSPYFVTLEFGKYEDKRNITDKKTVGKGKERFHGTTDGYSVQAPLGLLGRTLAEFSELERMAQKEGAFKNNFGYGKNFMSKFAIRDTSGVDDKFKPIKYKAKVVKSEKWKDSFYLEDFVNAVCEGKKKIELKELEPPYSSFYGTNTFAEELDEKWKEKKETDRYQKRKEMYELIRKMNPKYKEYTHKEIMKTPEYKNMVSEKKIKVAEEKRKLKVTGNVCGETKETKLSELEKLLVRKNSELYLDIEDFDEVYAQIENDSKFNDIAAIEARKEGSKLEFAIFTLDGETYDSLKEYVSKTGNNLSEGKLKQLYETAIRAGYKGD